MLELLVKQVIYLIIKSISIVLKIVKFYNSPFIQHSLPRKYGNRMDARWFQLANIVGEKYTFSQGFKMIILSVFPNISMSLIEAKHIKQSIDKKNFNFNVDLI